MADLNEQAQAGYKAGHNAATAAIAEIVGANDDNEASVKARIAEIMSGLRPQEQRKVLKGLRKEMNRTSRNLAAERAIKTHEIERLENMQAAFAEIEEWAKSGGFTLERPTGSVIHQLRQDIIDGTALVFHMRKEFPRVADDYEQEVFAESQIFLVEHDWAAAFAKAGDYEDDAEFHLPFEVCVFEFKISGHRAAIIATELEGNIYYEIAAKTSIGWFLLGRAVPWMGGSHTGKADEDAEGWGTLINFLAPQVKAICVALEAEVAETEVTRAPHKLNRAREKTGRVALSDFHTISLARKRRYAALPASASDEPKTQKRLHFRRGHWRHFETFKTWIRWTLVGNPDLGFVDKDYRL